MATPALSTRLTALPCFEHVRWQPDRRELHRFALWMFGGFAGLGLIGMWRAGGVGKGSLVLWGVGLVLAVSALIPGLGRAAYLGVYLASGLIGYVVSRIVLTLIFYLVFLPIGMALRALGHDLLRWRRPPGRSTWIRRAGHKEPASYYRQF